MNTYSIGIDIGGTNTDGVVVDQAGCVITTCKTLTTPEVSQGVTHVLNYLLEQSRLRPDAIMGIFIGTTHATNALLERAYLYKVGAIRIAGHYPTIPVAYGWPSDARNALLCDVVTIDGGFECDGRPITLLSHTQIRMAIEKLLKAGAESFAVTGVFSPVNAEHEQYVAELIREIVGSTVPISLSHTIGGIGFIERENATVLNAALKKSMKLGFENLELAAQQLGFTCSLYLTQNNGTVLPIEQALEFPILTIASGPTNSCMGAAKLAQLQDALVVDIGGTSTDVGIVRNGFVRRSAHSAVIGGIKLNFSMPDILSCALGGGSYITYDNNTLKIGPESSAKQVLKQALSFGGNRLTLLDCALAGNLVTIPGAQVELVAVSPDFIGQVMRHVTTEITYLIQILAGQEYGMLPVVVVGGGALLGLFNDNVYIPEHAAVANAYGAALAEISATTDTVVSLDQRERVLDQLREQTCAQAILQGADAASTRIVYQDIIPYSYMPGNRARVIITAAGKRAHIG